jgi:hypothetical protein
VRSGFFPWERTLVTVGVELGYALVGANGRVAGVPEVRLDGAWLGLSLGVGLSR